MSTPNDPYLTVPNYGQQNQNFGKEKMYSGYTAPSAVSDLAAAASNLQTGARTPDKGKYVYDSKTGQYIWVPATAAAAPVGIAASPAYINQDRGGGGSYEGGNRQRDAQEQARIDAFMDAEKAKDVALQTQENAEIGDRYAPVPNNFTQGQRIKDDLSFLSFLNPMNSPIVKGLQALFGTQNPNLVPVEDRTPVPVNPPPETSQTTNAQAQAQANAVAEGAKGENQGGSYGVTSGGGDTGTGNGRDSGHGDPSGNSGGVKNGGSIRMAGGGLGDLGGYSDGGRLLRGPGDGVSDSIPASIGNKRPARLANNEFVIPARIVSEIGNGSTDAGARRLYAMLDRIQAGRKKSIGKGKVAVDSKAYKELNKL